MHRLLPALLLLLLLASTALQASPILALNEGELLLHDGHSQHAHWQPVRLPDHWSERHPDTSGEGWYRLGFDWYGDERTVDVHVRQLRKKLGDALPLDTVWGLGYRLG